ncbi:hypothetical protein OS493_010718 [Desmophyllum pertusum]|uniref:Uncharacterized protein n=1 Tax=Desmophyllum pertusum TaxID=174260 RepID=A0A9W9ZR15_9CNID|nr:hypothetical protein OS493_010718 [Desmophyllum pertusum]
MADPVLPPLPDREPADNPVVEEAAPPDDRPAPPADAAPVEEHETNTAPSHSHVYNFSHCSVTLNIAGDNSAQASTSLSASQTAKRGYKRIIQDSESD